MRRDTLRWLVVLVVAGAVLCAVLQLAKRQRQATRLMRRPPEPLLISRPKPLANVQTRCWDRCLKDTEDVHTHVSPHEFVCPSVFRDMADYIVDWPWAHFGEVARHQPRIEDLPEGAVIFSQTGEAVKQFCNATLAQIQRPFVFVTSQSDYTPTMWCPRLLEHPLLMRWYAENADSLGHEKMRPIPIGLNCYEHGRAMHQFLEWKADQSYLPLDEDDKLLLVNFGLHTHPSRVELHKALCSAHAPDAHSFAHCYSKHEDNSVMDNPHLVGLYKQFSRFPFWLSPRGNGEDCHRTWEAMYAGSTPVLESSPLTRELYADMPAVVLPEGLGLQDVTSDLLRDEWKRLQHTAVQVVKLTPQYWVDRILDDAGRSKRAIRERCVQDCIKHSR